MDHTLVEIDENEDGVIEAKLRLVGVRLLYEVCRWQKLSVAELRECIVLWRVMKLLTRS